MISSLWISGSGNHKSFDEIILEARVHSRESGKIFIGTDSHLINKSLIFATAICLHGPNCRGGKYYFIREKVSPKEFRPLVKRILHEVERSIAVGHLLRNQDILNVELHIDASPSRSHAATSKFSDMLKGYVRGEGFECRIKPNAWASQSVADKHAR